MPPNTATLRVGPYLLSLLLVLVAAFGLVFLPGQRHTPKLGLDLEGGAQVTLQAQTPKGKTPNQSAMKVARQILENRVNANGVSAAQVYQQSNNQIVIAVPGANSQQVAKVGQAAKLNFRPVIFAGVPNTAPAPSSSASASAGTTAPSASASTATVTSPATAGKTSAATPTAAGTAAGQTTAASPTSPTPTPSATGTPATKLSADPFTKLGFALPTSDAAFNALTAAQQTALQTALGNFDCSSRPADVATKPLASCDNSNPPTAKYLLGPVIVAGTEVSSADAVAPSANGNSSWTVSINLKSKGQAAWADFTGKHHSAADNAGGATSCSTTTVPCADYVGFTLDGAVIGGPPQTQSTINGATQVSGDFSEAYAKNLANDLKYGALPLNFTQLTQQDVSPTLGSSQLKAGLLAGGIGLLLVVIYSFLYYRGLGFVTVASLLVSGALTYAALVILGREIGFTLTLAGIAGFIVAVGITADSFVVLFERLKDEVHSGRSLRVAVPRAWTQARRTILSADTVSFIAAAVLYYFTVGDVRGFAFTLGLSTLLDLVVVFLFTHPLVSLLSRSRAFGSPGFTGLNSVRVGGIAASPDASARPARRRRTQAAGGATALGAGSVALLEREDEADDFEADDVEPEGLDANDVYSDDGAARPVTGATPAPTGTRDPEPDSGAPRRSRVVPRSAPAGAIGADAAERAAARRGRAVRAPKPAQPEPVAQEPVEPGLLEPQLVEQGPVEQGPVEPGSGDPESGGQALVGHEPVRDSDVDAVGAETGLAPSGEAEPAPASEPVQFPVPAGEGTSTAAERAAARRQGGRSQSSGRGSRRRPATETDPSDPTSSVAPAPVVAPDPVDPPLAADDSARVEPAVETDDATLASVPAASAAPAGVEPPLRSASAPEAEVAVPSPTAEPGAAAEPVMNEPRASAEPIMTEPDMTEPGAPGEVPASKATAAERAAARRARIRSRAGHPINIDDEDKS